MERSIGKISNLVIRDILVPYPWDHQPALHCIALISRGCHVGHKVYSKRAILGHTARQELKNQRANIQPFISLWPRLMTIPNEITYRGFLAQIL
jgi:hypothetical protein